MSHCERRRPDLYLLRRPLFGDWLVGFRETFCRPACDWIELSVRFSFRPMTRVGVLPLASSRSCFLSAGVQGLPVLLVDLLMGDKVAARTDH
jgi:hypothetical protein